MDVRAELDSVQLETAAATVVGQIVFVLSRLEFNLGLYIRNAVGGQDPEAVNPLIERLSFKSKLDALREIVERRFADNSACRCEFMEWFGSMETFRAKRNSFVHGRWGVDHLGQRVINVTSGPPAGKPQKQSAYSLTELDGELSMATEIAAAFYGWSSRWLF